MPSRDAAPDLDVVEVAARLRLSVTRLFRQLRKRSDSDLTPTQGSVLATIAVHGPLALGELAERERVASPSITKVISQLHDRGLVVRSADPSDRRLVLVELTAAGRTLLDRVRANKNAWLAERIGELEPSDVAILEAATEVLERLVSDQAPA